MLTFTAEVMVAFALRAATMVATYDDCQIGPFDVRQRFRVPTRNTVEFRLSRSAPQTAAPSR